jgi:hypothetical protein
MIPHPELDALRALWVEKCGGRAMPSRAELDTGALVRWRTHAGSAEVDGDALRFRFQWVGQWLTAHYGAPDGARDPEDLSREIGAALSADFERACALKAPVFTLRPAYAVNETQYSELILPFSDDGDTVDALLVATYPLPKVH